MRWNNRAQRLGSLLAGVMLLCLRISAVPQTSAAPPQAAPPPAVPQAQTTVPVPAPAPPVPVILIDPAHGGTEYGAVLGPDNLEKDVTLAFARRLRQDLASRGVQVRLLRDSDALLSTDQRAVVANTSRPSLYLCIHATSQGSGVRIYSAMLSNTNGDRGPFIAWQAAQASAISRSRSLQQQLTAAIQKTRFPVHSLTAPVQPLNNIVAPAIAIELAPASGQASQLATADYQNMVSAVLANAITSIRSRLESGQ
jgi:N-acetylmuramoyl-L-alanine amidase